MLSSCSHNRTLPPSLWPLHLSHAHYAHLNLDFYFYLITDEATGKKKLKVNAWFSSRVTTVAIRTALSHVTNLINGVRKGYRYKMHFINRGSVPHAPPVHRLWELEILDAHFSVLSQRVPRVLPWRRSVTSASTHLIETYPSLQPKTAVFTHNDGQSPPGHGTVPIFFQGVTYNIPVIMWLMDSSPEERAIHMQAEVATSCMHFAASLLRLRQVVDAMAVEMHAGLASEGGSKLKMLLTYICDLPTGNKKGIYYALDLGGTDFPGLASKVRWPKELFDYIATSLKDFVEREENASEPSQSQGEKSRLGFTFSFPVKQTSSSSVKLTNGFSIDYMVVRDVAMCFQEAIYRKGLNMQVASL
ncbi:hexokinase, partial [Striga asiatica]